MFEETRKIVFLVGFIITYAIRFYFARFAKQNKKVVDGRVTVQEKVLLFLTIVGMLVFLKRSTKARYVEVTVTFDG